VWLTLAGIFVAVREKAASVRHPRMPVLEPQHYEEKAFFICFLYAPVPKEQASAPTRAINMRAGFA
jgi:hypothetical protein